MLVDHGAVPSLVLGYQSLTTFWGLVTTIFQVLRDDHDKQRTLSSLLTKTHGESQGREELFARLRNKLESHAGAGERYFYRVLMNYDLTQDTARHSVSEHKQIDDLIEKLAKTAAMSSSGWLPVARELSHLVTHHLDEEEQEVFQLAGKVLGEAELALLAKQYRQDREERLQV